MLRQNRSRFTGVLALIVAIATLLATPATADQKHGSLELHRWKHLMDGGGQLWLSLQMTNTGASPVTINGIALSAFGPWSDVSQTAEPGQRIRAQIKIDAQTAEAKSTDVWLYSTEGLAKFTVTRRQ